MKATTHLAFAFVFGVFAFGLIVFIIALGQVELWSNILWWIYLCEVVLVIVTWINYQDFKRKQTIEQNLITQVIELEDTKEISTRTIIQIAATDSTLCALCTDGTVWVQSFRSRQPEWVRLPGIQK